MNVLPVFTTVISMLLAITLMVHLVADVPLDIVAMAFHALVSRRSQIKLDLN